jgi:hypothetical protein
MCRRSVRRADPPGVADEQARAQLEALVDNTRRFGIENFPMGDPRGGIVHVVGPEQGRSQPGMTIVCGDSHTSTHGAFGALAFRDRHVGGRACAGDADDPPAPVAQHARNCRGALWRRTFMPRISRCICSVRSGSMARAGM